MKSARILMVSICFVLLFGMLGCKARVPSDFPKTVPYKVKVTRQGAPLAEAMVHLQPNEGIGAYSVSGKTDKNGVAVINTIRGRFIVSGAPVGSYKLSLEKRPEVPDPLSSEEKAKMSLEDLTKHIDKLEAERAKLPLIIPTILTEAATTPIEVSISKNDSSTEVDLDKYK